MKKINEKIGIYEILKSFSYSMDLISETVVGHHNKVAYISLELGKEMNLSNTQLKKLVISALIHDLGVFYLHQSFSDLSFDSRRNQHAEIGYHLLKNNSPIADIPEIIRYHHHEWDKKNNDEIPRLSNILHLADRIAVLIKDDSPILSQKKRIIKIIKKNRKLRFCPEAVEKFIKLSIREDFWLNIISNTRIEKKLDDFFLPPSWLINYDEVLKISNLISHIIDFRSSFTATHSEGIAAISAHLSKYLNFNKKEQKKMKIAGYLHDIGKLVVPPAVLNKSGKLTNEEWNIMKTHTYYTYQALSTTENLNTIREWASYHHEKLNGKGYPFHLNKNQLSLGSKIMGVSDVFTAITEDRPYRKGMEYSKVKIILNEMAVENELDEELVGIVLDDFDEFNDIREEVQVKTKKYFNKFNRKAKNILDSLDGENISSDRPEALK
ncbi:MAG TPA: HD domain-containing phosphohydrolase [Halanaerobiales bacterium]|nr:HD domain-containing phosphohydrolase [Halanaerobiales bacterium]